MASKKTQKMIERWHDYFVDRRIRRNKTALATVIVEEGGVGYQPCGGGRRIIRKKTGGA